MENERLVELFQEFLIYLREPIKFEQLNDDKVVINDPAVKKFKNACGGNNQIVIKAMELVAKNISHLDLYKSGIVSKLLIETIDITTANNFLISFIIGMFLRNLSLCDKYIFMAQNYIENSDIAINAPNELRAWKSLDHVAEPTIIILSLNITARMKLRENKNYYTILCRLKPFAKPIEHILNIYNLSDEKEIIFIYPQKLAGFRVILNGIQNNFHLFTLVQNELAQKAGNILGISAPQNPDSVQIAKGIKKFDIDRKIPEFGLMSFYTWRAYYESQNQKTSYNSKYMIQGKTTPQNIPVIGGQRIVILGESERPPIQWDTYEFRPLNQYLTSETRIVEILGREFVSDILRKIQSVTPTGSPFEQNQF